MDDEAAADAGALFDMATMATVAAQIGGPDGHAARSAFLDGMITKGIDADLKAFLLAENLRVEPARIAALFVDHCTIDWSETFARVDRPVLVIGGRVSHVNSRSQDWIHAQLPDSRLVIFEEAEGCAHFPFLESPETFNAVLDDFLAAQTAAAEA
jgi:pimeloyl-ACP methyl ester carboxylesterase